TATDSASVTVTYTNVNPTIKVTKSADVSTISEGGVGNQTVVYTYTVKNTSPASTDTVTVTSLSDDKAAGALAAFYAANGNSYDLAPGQSVTFTLTQTLPVDNAGDTSTTTVSASALHDALPISTATDSASVTVTYTNVNPT